MTDNSPTPTEDAKENKSKWHQQPWVRCVGYIIFVWLVMPALAQFLLYMAGFFAGAILPRKLFPEMVVIVLMVIVCAATPLGLGYVCRFSQKRMPQPDQTFFQRYAVEASVILYVLLLSCASMVLSHEMFINKELHPVMWVGLPSFLLIFVLISFASVYSLFFIVPLVCYSLYFFGVLLKTWRLGCFKVHATGLLPMALVAVVLMGFGSWKLYEQHQGTLTVEEHRMAAISEGGRSRYDEPSDEIQYRYRPFEASDDLTPLRTEAQLHIASDFPRLDGATALFPIYASAVQAVYKAPETHDERTIMAQLINCSRTPHAYQRLIDGEVDLIFAAGPSAKQIEAAKEKGLELTLTPVGKEAFVFLVNEQNPVHSLTAEQIRAIYAGRINRWDEVGGAAKVIRPFQRPEGSGSQSAMLRLMQGTPLREPLREEFYEGMGGMVVGVANYRNAENALGYSFRFYATAMNKVDGIKLLAVDGIEPTRENIRNGSYPLTSDFYMVTAPPVSENTQKLMDWFVSEQGQQLIEDVGYVSLTATN